MAVKEPTKEEVLTVGQENEQMALFPTLMKTRSAEGVMDELSGFYDKDALVDGQKLFYITKMIQKESTQGKNKYFWSVDVLVEGSEGETVTISLGSDQQRDKLASIVAAVPDAPIGPFLMERRPSAFSNSYYGFHAVNEAELRAILHQRKITAEMDIPF